MAHSHPGMHLTVSFYSKAKICFWLNSIVSYIKYMNYSFNKLFILFSKLKFEKIQYRNSHHNRLKTVFAGTEFSKWKHLKDIKILLPQRSQILQCKIHPSLLAENTFTRPESDVFKGRTNFNVVWQLNTPFVLLI